MNCPDTCSFQEFLTDQLDIGQPYINKIGEFSQPYPIGHGGIEKIYS